MVKNDLRRSNTTTNNNTDYSKSKNKDKRPISMHSIEVLLSNDDEEEEEKRSNEIPPLPKLIPPLR